MSYMSKEYLSTRTLTYDLTFDVLMLLLLNNLIFILFPRFPGPLFALPYCHQFLAPIKTILSWHHTITFFCRWTFTKSFGTKQAQIIFGLLFTPGQRCRGIYQSTPTIRKHDMFSGPLQRSNVVIEFYHFLVQGRLFRVLRLREVGRVLFSWEPNWGQMRINIQSTQILDCRANPTWMCLW